EIHVAHDVFDGGEGAFGAGVEVHGQPDAGEQLVDQYHDGQDAEDVPKVEVLRRVVLAHVLFERLHPGQARVDPAPQAAGFGFVGAAAGHQEFSESSPITITLSFT